MSPWIGLLVVTLAAPPEGAARRERANLAVGGTCVGLALGALGMMSGGIAMARPAEADYVAGPTRKERDDALRRGQTANGLVIAGAVGAAGLAILGAVLLTRGVRQRRARLSLTPAPDGVALRF